MMRVLGRIALILLLPASAPAAVLDVDAVHDEVDAAPGDGACAAPSGSCTLRAAFMEANALAGPDTIRVPAGTYSLSLAGGEEDFSATGDLDVRDELTLRGAGMDATIISASGLDRGIHVVGTAFEALDLTVRDGQPAGSGNMGAGVFAADSTLTLRRLRLTAGRFAVSGSGAGLEASRCASLLEDCEIVGNDATRGPSGGGGGGISSSATFREDDSRLVMIRCLVEGNFASVGGGIAASHADIRQCTIRGNIGGRGGGIFIERGSIVDTTISGNRSDATFNEGCGGFVATAVRFENVTISGNWSASDDGLWGGCGGGCTFDTGSMSSSTFDHVTITDNEAVVSGGGYCDHSGPGQWFSNSIIAGNRAASFPDVRSALGLHGPTLLGDATGVTLYGDVSQVRSGAAQLGSLESLGGRTQVHALLDGSAAIDAANDARCVHADGSPMTADQRGAPRPVDGDGSGTVACDLGAFEKPEPGTSDLDGDGIPDPLDCAPTDPDAWGIPPEPTLRVVTRGADGVRVLWDDVLAGRSSRSRFDIASGDLAALHAGDLTTTCLERDWPDTSHDDFRPLPPGGRYWMVRAVSPCSTGWGSDTSGAPRTACP